ncbi:hypothetical protein GQ53DRAFT_800282 [Thozetella sp. PMI_491]|nr:hypothetical protein GQ53DRAFT_800282 [Thozetella sp. PMI_491]
MPASAAPGPDVARFRNPIFTKEAALAALRGEALPDGLARRVLRLCTIRGIRYHSARADGPARVLHGVLPEFTRALNARAIMSGKIPDMDPSRPEEFPYCIWHPEMASEETYQALARRYPSMAYHVGRACAVAGYSSLYRELDILPEVAIAEEACASGSKAIFDAIMSCPTKYKVFGDYTRSVESSNPHPANLNGDTAVRPMLEIKQRFHAPDGARDLGDPLNDLDEWDPWGGEGYKEQLFNITEDLSIDEIETDARELLEDPPPFADNMSHLLTSPLPSDLPAGNKDLLILMAASKGNIDRYARLRRPVPHRSELYCVIRGIYHNSMFAIWFSQAEQPTQFRRSVAYNEITAAINARFGIIQALPYLIWYPTLAQPSTYAELARRIPRMRPAVLRAAVFGDMREVFDQVMADPAFCPDGFTLAEAESSHIMYYKEAILKRGAELGVDLSYVASSERDGFGGGISGDGFKWYSVRADAKNWRGYPKSSYDISSSVGLWQIAVGTENIANIYNGIGCNTSEVELMLAVPQEWRPKKGEYYRELDYVYWPEKKSLGDS